MWLSIRLKLVKHVVTSPEKKENLPDLTLIIPAYNEINSIAAKVDNCIQLDYPKHLLRIIFITDGSTDGTNKYLESIEGVELMHQNLRGGKAAAENRSIEVVTTEWVVFSDANTVLQNDALRILARHFDDPKIGTVSGEKRIFSNQQDAAASVGEGFYWRYESTLKALESNYYTLLGAAGELIAFRTELFSPLETDTILDDFVQTVRIALNGYKVVYEPKAIASEAASLNVKEEWKRKVRISAGAWQAMSRLPQLWHFWKHPQISLMFFSRRFSRWVLAPLAVFLVLFSNVWLAFLVDSLLINSLLLLQIVFYAIAFLGYLLQEKSTKFKLLFVPFYFTMMLLAPIFGAVKYYSGKQSVLWEKAKRS